jgi:hypothetical protein
VGNTELLPEMGEDRGNEAKHKKGRKVTVATDRKRKRMSR